jgi:hypothetical protein
VLQDAAVLFLLGGAPRCGKTSLAARIAGERGIGWLSTDTVRDVVNLHVPLFEVGGIGRSHRDEADRFFSSFETIARSCAVLAADYVIEGVGFYPRHVAQLDDGLAVRAVFVGQSTVAVDDILRHEGRNAWHRHLDEATLARLPAWIEAWSAELAEECSTYGFPYVDLAAGADGFVGGQARVEALLFSDRMG